MSSTGIGLLQCGQSLSPKVGRDIALRMVCSALCHSLRLGPTVSAGPNSGVVDFEYKFE